MTYAAPANITSATGMFQYINGTISNWFFPGIILGVFAIIFIKMMTNEGNTVGKSFAASSFVCMIISVFSRVLDFVNTPFMTIMIILTAVGAIWMHFENSGG